MTESTVAPAALTAPLPSSALLDSRRLLQRAAASWAAVAIAGQLLFGLYVLLVYGGALLAGAPERWNAKLTRAYVAGDWVGNALTASHLLGTLLVVVIGALQLLPALRRRRPALHRWGGRIYVSAAALAAAGGMTMLWTRGTVGDLTQHIGISINGLVVLACALLAWRAARAGRFDAHRRWALRLWLAVAGVWFFRITLMLWVGVNQGAVGFDFKSFTGPFLSGLAFAQTLLPLALLQLYFRAQASRSGLLQTGVGLLLAICTLLTAAGVAAAALMMWWPDIVRG